MLQKNYFDYQKKITSKSLKYLDFISFKIKKKTLLEINKCVVDLFNYNEDKNFKNIYQVQKFLNKTKFYHLKRDLNIMTKLEKIICSHFVKLKIFNKYIKGIQFPINIRTVHPALPNRLINRKYLSSLVHCDSWADDPIDIIKCIIYLTVNKNTPRINIFQSNEKDKNKYSEYANLYKNKFFMNSKKHLSILNQLEKLQPYPIKHVNGQVFIFSGLTPHHTIREGNEVRISLDFSIKTKNPYKDTDKWNNYNNHERYWFLPNGKENYFFQRLKYEYLKLKKFKNYQKLISLRSKSVENLILSNL